MGALSRAAPAQPGRSNWVGTIRGHSPMAWGGSPGENPWCQQPHPGWESPILGEEGLRVFVASEGEASL